MTAPEIKQKYESEYGIIETNGNYSLQIKQSQKGNWVVILWYERNSYVNPEKERQVIYDKEGNKIHVQ